MRRKFIVAFKVIQGKIIVANNLIQNSRMIAIHRFMFAVHYIYPLADEYIHTKDSQITKSNRSFIYSILSL